MTTTNITVNFMEQTIFLSRSPGTRSHRQAVGIEYKPKDKEFIRIAIDLMPDEPWDDDTWDKWTSAIKEKTIRKGKELFLPMREAFTGVCQCPEMKKLIQ